MCKTEIFYYKNSILSLLQRMRNLKELSLYVCINDQTVVDGNILKNDIIQYLPKLNKFIFNIRSLFRVFNPIDLPSCEQMQHTLTDLGKNQINFYVDYFPDYRNGQCHIYTYPYQRWASQTFSLVKSSQVICYENQVKSSRVTRHFKSSQVKSRIFQVKSSQVMSSQTQ
jgi:hypothetical protein